MVAVCPTSGGCGIFGIRRERERERERQREREREKAQGGGVLISKDAEIALREKQIFISGRREWGT